MESVCIRKGTAGSNPALSANNRYNICMKRLNELILRRLLAILLFFSSVAVLMLASRLFVTGSTRLGFLIWNMMLAWIPLAAALWFVPTGRSRRPFISAVLLIIWLLFLPNTFYILSDFIHSRALGDINILFDVVMLFLYSCIGFGIGIMSLGIIHSWLRRALSNFLSTSLIYVSILLCSFAMYLGRFLRWNSWDIVVNPLGLLVDISDRVVAPLDHPKTLSTTFVFFIFISLVYSAAWWLKHNFSSLLNREV